MATLNKALGLAGAIVSLIYGVTGTIDSFRKRAVSIVQIENCQLTLVIYNVEILVPVVVIITKRYSLSRPAIVVSNCYRILGKRQLCAADGGKK